MDCENCPIYSSVDPCGPLFTTGESNAKTSNCIYLKHFVIIPFKKGRHLTDVVDWIDENCKGTLSYRSGLALSPMRFKFELKEDAILAKMTFMDIDV